MRYVDKNGFEVSSRGERMFTVASPAGYTGEQFEHYDIHPVAPIGDAGATRGRVEYIPIAETPGRGKRQYVYTAVRSSAERPERDYPAEEYYERVDDPYRGEARQGSEAQLWAPRPGHPQYQPMR